MWKKVIITLAIAACFCRVSAASPEEYLERQKELYEKRIEHAEKKLKLAEEDHEKQINDAIDTYIKALEKVKQYWTKKGELSQVLSSTKMLNDFLNSVGRPQSAEIAEQTTN